MGLKSSVITLLGRYWMIVSCGENSMLCFLSAYSKLNHTRPGLNICSWRIFESWNEVQKICQDWKEEYETERKIIIIIILNSSLQPNENFFCKQDIFELNIALQLWWGMIAWPAWGAVKGFPPAQSLTVGSRKNNFDRSKKYSLTYSAH